MKFECDSCHAQYMIADEKVGKRGVKVKCKKCQHVIIVRPESKPVVESPITRNAQAPSGLDFDSDVEASRLNLAGPHPKRGKTT